MGNAFGLEDVLGNVEELVELESGALRAGRRGGSWCRLPSECTLDRVEPLSLDVRSFSLGLRVCRSLPEEALVGGN